ncbi:MAG: YaiI/YqxD family protein [Rhodobacteraceae bacterium]|jgi:uncharacterized protein YaiI (UPF0178 family)|nr:YaiI/YqxD family protein [Paracoccaceae bacterium]NDD33240.1 YaiI/YqxD family protein [Paracoccaceae bacterium]
MTKIYVDADACPVKAEVEKTATRHKIAVFVVSNGGIRPSQNPIVTTVVVDHGADVADQWIADHCGPGDIVVTSDIPLAARTIEHGSLVVKPNGEILTSKNIGPVLAARDLMSDIRSADPFFQGRSKAFSKSDRSRFLDALERVIRQSQG